MSDSDQQFWAQVLAHMRVHHSGTCRAWFDEIEPLGIGSGALQLRTSSAFHRDYLQAHVEPFNDAARTISGHLISVRFLGPEDTPVLPAIKAKPARENHLVETKPDSRPGNPVQPPRADSGSGVHGADTEGQRPDASSTAQRSESVLTGKGPPGHAPRDQSLGNQAPGEGTDSTVSVPHAFVPPEPRPQPVEMPRHNAGRPQSFLINPDYSFDHFVVGPNNEFAHAAAMAIAANPGRVYNPFFIHGGVGLGKTHLLQAICLKLAQTTPMPVMHYTSCEAFVTQFIESVQSGEMSQFRHRFREVDVLVIDDIHFLAKRDRTQEEFFHTFNCLYQAQKQIILSSDAPPEEIPELEDRLVSRFKWGLVLKIEAPCYETRVAILKTKARLRGMPMPDTVAEYIANRIDTNIRELEGAIVKLHIQSTVEKRPIDLDLARASLGDVGREVIGEPSIQSIISAVTEFYRIKLTDLQSKHRQRSITLPRQMCMYLARRLTRHSLEEIGGYFGGRDHTTVMHANRIVEAKRLGDVEFDAVLRSLEARIKKK